MLKYCRNLVNDIKAYLIGFKVGLLAIVDTLKYMYGDEHRPYFVYLYAHDEKAYIERADQICDKYADQRLRQEMLKIIDHEFKRARKRLGHKTKKVR